MMEEERARNDMQARAMYELLVVSFICRLLASLNIRSEEHTSELQ